ncbi:MAG: alanine racemase [Elusimicrobia bacterium RIFOXYB2_FULL_49_7]|nr:MAG: alanine racemase [Elusimicrobia bacterium RIFOXYB2_FULL_49_7]
MIDKLGVKWVEIDLDALAHNFREIKKRVAPAKVMAVVKADAYGHGAVEVARTAARCGIRSVGVSCLEEAIELRRNFIKGEILIFGALPVSQICDLLNYDLMPSVCTEAFAEALSDEAGKRGKAIPVHVCVDTGMGRVGPYYTKALPLLQRVAALSHLKLAGLYSHFATADSESTTFARIQEKRFNLLLKQIVRAGITIPIIHIANSGGVLNLAESYFKLVRPGLITYGIYPCQKRKGYPILRNVLTFKSRVSFVQSVGKGFTVGYGCRYVTKGETDIVTLPIGYADGFSRHFSNRGAVIINGRRMPVVGSVCMDMIMVDAGKHSGIREGDVAVIIGRQGKEEISVYDIARSLRTIPYEVICMINRRVTRLYIKGRKSFAVKRMITEF